VVVGLDCSRNPESYAGGSIPAGMASHVIRSKVSTQNKRDTLVRQVGSSVWGWHPQLVKNIIVMQLHRGGHIPTRDVVPTEEDDISTATVSPLKDNGQSQQYNRILLLKHHPGQL